MEPDAVVPNASPIFRLCNADIHKLALCKVGANQQRIFLLKSDDDDAPDEEKIAAVAQLVKEPGDDWRTAYVPVAVPDSEEKPGMFGDPDSHDVWDSLDEIAKAAHSYMRNGSQVVSQHFASERADGVQLVESAVALADFKVGETLIKEGTWYVGLEFDGPLRELVSKGEIDAVSVEGLADRLAKSEPLADLLVKLDQLTDSDREWLAKGSLERVPGVQNWIEKLPAPLRAAWNRSIIYRAAVHMNAERGMTVGHAIASAINWAKHICTTRDVKQWRGPQTVNPKSWQECCSAVALWESMKAASGGQDVAKEDFDAIETYLDSEPAHPLVRAIAKKIGMSDQEDQLIALAGVSAISPAHAALVKEASTGGAMVALYPPKAVAEELSMADGEAAGEIHLTLAFLGPDADALGDPDAVLGAVKKWASESEPLAGEISGTGKFTSGEKPVTYASVDLPGIPKLREQLLAALEAAGKPADKSHGFTPHMTLDYADRDVKIEEPIKVSFETVTVKWGGTRRDFALGLRGEGGNVAKQMDDAALTERFETVETLAKETADSVAALTGDEGQIAKIGTSLEELAKRIPEPEEKAPTPAEVGDRLEVVAKSINDKLGEVAAAVEQLEEGQPSDTDHQETVAKSASANGDGEFAGMLFD